MASMRNGARDRVPLPQARLGSGAAAPPELTIRIDRKVYPAVAGQPALQVLTNVAIDVAPTSFVVVTGPSGCGKSTLLNIVAGLDRDYQGSVSFHAADPRLAFVFQTPRLLPWRTVEQNLALALPDKDPRAAGIPDMLARVGLAAAAGAYPERISLGMQRRVALARAFLLEPDILLMDEPFVSLDEETARDLRKLLMQLWGRRPTTVLFVTHDRAEAVELGTRILRLEPASASMRSSIVADSAVALSPADRADRDKLRIEQARIFGQS
jgi:NitT/TauT family transport system ATP-binding protein